MLHDAQRRLPRRGVSIEEIMMYLGHTNIDTSYEHYLRRTDTLVERISAKFEQ